MVYAYIIDGFLYSSPLFHFLCYLLAVLGLQLESPIGNQKFIVLATTILGMFLAWAPCAMAMEGLLYVGSKDTDPWSPSVRL